MTEVSFLRNKVEELALKCAEAEEGKRAEEKLRQRTESEKASLERALREKEDDLQSARLDQKRQKMLIDNQWEGVVSEKDSALASLRTELKIAQDRLAVREADLERVSAALRDRENENKRADQTIRDDKMSLVLEVERLNRDLAHYEADLDHARAELERKQEELRKRDMEAATLVSFLLGCLRL